MVRSTVAMSRSRSRCCEVELRSVLPQRVDLVDRGVEHLGDPLEPKTERPQDQHPLQPQDLGAAVQRDDRRLASSAVGRARWRRSDASVRELMPASRASCAVS